jgi:hypothetical protein
MFLITLTPVGRVHSPRIEAKDDFWQNLVTVIELDPTRLSPDSVLGPHRFLSHSGGRLLPLDSR